MATRIIDGMEQGGWLDIRSFKGYSHDVPDRRREAMNARPSPGNSLTRDAQRTRK
jgi:hypothetical protein